MTAVIITMFFILLLAVASVGVVAIGMQGAMRERAPKLSHQLAEAARHMNGDAQPPQALVDLMPQQAGSKH